MTNYPIQKLSFSCLRTFYTNPGEFKDRYILNDSRRVYTPAQLVGRMSHMVLEMYLTGTELEKAVTNAHNWLETINDADVKWWKTGNREKIAQDFTKAIKNYFEEMPEYHKIHAVEQEMYFDISDVIEWKVIKSPLPFHGIADLVFESKDGSLIVEDYKFVSSFKDGEEENPAYIFQAFFYYYLVKAQYGRAPSKCVFREVKISQNKDGSSQHNCITVPYSGPAFDENKVYFWYNVSSFLRQIENADENTIFLHNIFDMQTGAENFRRQKETVFGYKREEVKNSEFSQTEERGAKEVRFIEQQQASTIEDKIRVKFQDYGVALKFSQVERGYTYDRYLFEPGRGVKMSKIVSLREEIKQGLEVKNIRIEAPVSGTKFVGIEIQRQERVFLPITASEIVRPEAIPLGRGIDWVTHYIDLSDPNTPHVYAVGQTGSGKSEFMKVAVESLKDSCDLILLDPKRTELVGYKDCALWYWYDDAQIDNTLGALYKAMMDRYDALAKMGCKDIEEYRARTGQQIKRTVIVFEEYGKSRLSIYGKSIEHSILQLCSLGRACGYHVILSTQRPEVKIISGAIKANIGTRVCFAVASSVDSKVALDEIGAESLAGKGDMLFKYPGQDTQRLQSFFIPRNENKTEETKRIPAKNTRARK